MLAFAILRLKLLLFELVVGWCMCCCMLCSAATLRRVQEKDGPVPERKVSVVVTVAVAVTVAVLLLLGKEQAAYRPHGHEDDDDDDEDDENVSVTRVAGREKKEITMPLYEER